MIMDENYFVIKNMNIAKQEEFKEMEGAIDFLDKQLRQSIL